MEGCPSCGESDPLIFTGPDSSGAALCRTCGRYLGGSTDAAADIGDERGLQAVEDDYRGALVGAAPVLLPKTTAMQFRVFFEKMLHLLTRSLNRCSRHKTVAGSFSRQDVLAMIAALVLNAAPNPNESTRCRRRARGLRLWATLLSVIPEYEGATMEQTSIRWPLILRRRFLAGLYYRTRKRSPYTPYRPATYLDKPVKRVEVAAAFGLAVGTQSKCQTPAV